jgi:hypothetical protein
MYTVYSVALSRFSGLHARPHTFSVTQIALSARCEADSSRTSPGSDSSNTNADSNAGLPIWVLELLKVGVDGNSNAGDSRSQLTARRLRVRAASGFRSDTSAESRSKPKRFDGETIRYLSERVRFHIETREVSTANQTGLDRTNQVAVQR